MKTDETVALLGPGTPAGRYDLELRSIPSAVRRAADRWPDAEAVIDGPLRWTFRDADALMRSAIRGAVALGVRRGDRVAVWGPNTANWILAALAIHGAGGILVPINTRYRADEATHILRNSGATGLFVTGDFLGRDYVTELRTTSPDLPVHDRTVLLDGPDRADAMSWAAFLAGGDAVAPAEVDRLIDAIGPDDVADIMFTSGTTGAPKGAQLTHGSSLRAFGMFGDRLTWRAGERHLIVPPFFHTFGYKAGWLASFIHGVASIPVKTFDVAAVLATIERERVNILLGPPTVYLGLLDDPHRDDYDLSSLRVCCPGAAGSPDGMHQRLRDELGFRVVLGSYGLTEATSTVSLTLPTDPIEIAAGTSGRPFDGIDVVIVDDAGAAVPAETAGEILVRGWNITPGYWQDPAATANAIDADGWLHTGDVGHLDAEGRVIVTDRKKDMYISGGFNVYPAEVERLLRARGGIHSVAVIGVPDARAGEVGAAYVVPAEGETLTSEQVIDWSRAHMANFKVPRYVAIVDALPLNASGKVLKNRLRETFAGGPPAVS